MKYRILGKTGVQVSQLCFGTMSFGGDADTETSAAMFHRCREVGINFFDCANVYVGGRSEEILGKLIADCRDEIVLTSKVGVTTGGDVNAGGLLRRHIMLAVEDSLKRLGTDRLDLYFVHIFDAKTPIEGTLRALDDLVHQGKILYPAVSNWAAWQIARALGISAREGLARFECIQPMYNLVKRQAEVEILPLAQAEQMGVISYSPLGGGLLDNKTGLFPAEAPESVPHTQLLGGISSFAKASSVSPTSVEVIVTAAALRFVGTLALIVSFQLICTPIVGVPVPV